MDNRSFLLRSLILTALCGLLLAVRPWNAGAIGTEPAETSRVAIVNILTVLDGLDEHDARKAVIDARGKQVQSKLDDLIKQAESLQEQIKLLPKGTAERDDKALELIELDAVMKTRGKILQAKFNQDFANLLFEMYQKSLATIETIAQREGYDMVVLDDRPISQMLTPSTFQSNEEALSVIFKRQLLSASDAIDITNIVVTKMNNDFNALNN